MERGRLTGTDETKREGGRGSQTAETNQAGRVSECLGAALHEI